MPTGRSDARPVVLPFRPVSGVGARNKDYRSPMDGLCTTRSLVAHRLAETLVTASGELWLRVPQLGIEDAFRQ